MEGIPTSEALQQLQRGVDIKGYRTKPCTAIAIPPPDVPERNPNSKKKNPFPRHGWPSPFTKERTVGTTNDHQSGIPDSFIRVQIGESRWEICKQENGEVSKNQIFSR